MSRKLHTRLNYNARPSFHLPVGCGVCKMKNRSKSAAADAVVDVTATVLLIIAGVCVVVVVLLLLLLLLLSALSKSHRKNSGTRESFWSEKTQ